MLGQADALCVVVGAGMSYLSCKGMAGEVVGDDDGVSVDDGDGDAPDDGLTAGVDVAVFVSDAVLVGTSAVARQRAQQRARSFHGCEPTTMTSWCTEVTCGWQRLSTRRELGATGCGNAIRTGGA